jgi:glycosyltransferase involved in cell wall biosynthesis
MRAPAEDGFHLLTVVMPVFNEERYIRRAVERMLAVELPIPFELVIVDDGSTDGSRAAVEDLLDDRRVRWVANPRNLGKGAAIHTGIDEARGDLLTVLDADLEYDPADYVGLLKAVLDDDARVVYGKRGLGAHTAYSFWYVLGNRSVNLWASFLNNAWVTDVETCFKMAETQIWRSLGLRSKGFGIEAEATGQFLRSGYRIHEVPISYRARTRGEGKKLRWTDGVEALLILLRVRLGR